MEEFSTECKCNECTSWRSRTTWNGAPRLEIAGSSLATLGSFHVDEEAVDKMQQKEAIERLQTKMEEMQAKMTAMEEEMRQMHLIIDSHDVSPGIGETDSLSFSSTKTIHFSMQNYGLAWRRNLLNSGV